MLKEDVERILNAPRNSILVTEIGLREPVIINQQIGIRFFREFEQGKLQIAAPRHLEIVQEKLFMGSDPTRTLPPGSEGIGQLELYFNEIPGTRIIYVGEGYRFTYLKETDTALTLELATAQAAQLDYYQPKFFLRKLVQRAGNSKSVR